MAIINNSNKYWFKAKLYGWGWTPSTWQGWVITGVYIILAIIISSAVNDSTPERDIILKVVLPMILLTSLLIFIAYKKGEKPHWLWGKPKSK